MQGKQGAIHGREAGRLTHHRAGVEDNGDHLAPREPRRYGELLAQQVVNRFHPSCVPHVGEADVATNRNGPFVGGTRADLVVAGHKLNVVAAPEAVLCLHGLFEVQVRLACEEIMLTQGCACVFSE